MIRTIALAYWDIKRICRSGRAVTAVLAVPLLSAVFCFFDRGSMLRIFFPGVAIFTAWLLLYVRSTSDRASGFATGIDSTPAAGTIIFISRFLTWLLVFVLQTILFFATIRLAA